MLYYNKVFLSFQKRRIITVHSYLVSSNENSGIWEVRLIKQYRNEWKYPCTENDLAILEDRLDAVLDRDANSGATGIYEIHSLYFDDIFDSCAKENEAGVSARFKYRIRYYGDNPNFMKLERKEKLNGRCHKDSCRLTLEQYRQIISGEAEELFWETENELLKQFCVHIMTKGFTPKVIVDYERVAFVEEITNIRITLDKNISVSDEIEHFLDGDYLRVPIQEKQRQVLEVKFDYILPGYIRHLVTNKNLVQTSFSKYYLGRKKLQSTGR